MGVGCMGYMIEYGCGSGVKLPIKKKKRFALPIAIFLMACLAGAMLVPRARITVRDLLLPGDGAVTAEALQNLASDLKSGEAFSDAVTAFCHQILEESGQ